MDTFSGEQVGVEEVSQKACLVIQELFGVRLVPVRLGRITKETTIFAIEGGAVAQLIQCEDNVLQVAGLAGGFVKVD